MTMINHLKLMAATLVLSTSASVASAQSAFVGAWETNWVDPQSNCAAKVADTKTAVEMNAGCSARLTLKFDQAGTGLAGSAKTSATDVDGVWEVKGANAVLIGTLSNGGRTLTGTYYLPGSQAEKVLVGKFEFTITNDKRFDGTYTKPFDPVSKGAPLAWWGIKK